MSNILSLKEARKIAKDNDRKLRVKTIDFTDLSRDSAKFWTISPAFKVVFTDGASRLDYLKSLSDGELTLYTADYLKDDKTGELIKYC